MTRVKTFAVGLKWIDETLGCSRSELLQRAIIEVDEAVAELGDVEIKEVHDALYVMPVSSDVHDEHNYPIFTRRIIYRPAES